MQWVGRAELAAAVSNAGALGILTALTQPMPEDLVKEIRRCRELTDKPSASTSQFCLRSSLLPYVEYNAAAVDLGGYECQGSSEIAAPAALYAVDSLRTESKNPLGASAAFGGRLRYW
jgi:NAD(P)H-dependent flavin oxidoreductase YrpB (nitropropane dioxygenase family)